LQVYHNLLNAFAALFYTNHRMQDVSIFFSLWHDKAMELQAKRQAIPQDRSVNKKQIQIDTDMVN